MFIILWCCQTPRSSDVRSSSTSRYTTSVNRRISAATWSRTRRPPCAGDVAVSTETYPTRSSTKRSHGNFFHFAPHYFTPEPSFSFSLITSGQSNLTKRPHRRRTLTVPSFSPGCTSVHPHVTHASLDPPESTSQTASRSVKRFLHG